MGGLHRIFIDGQMGTTGLQITERLQSRDDLELITIADEERKNPATKKKILNEVDLVIFCLPDSAALESLSLIDNPKVKVLDASTAHRVHQDWVYGLPELLPDQRQKIKIARRVTNPGCYPTGVLLGVKPLLVAGVIEVDYPLVIHAVSGYSGGGRQLIEEYQQADRSDGSWSLRPYSLTVAHKHIPEIQHLLALSNPPVFAPAVADVKQGMLVTIPLHPTLFKKQLSAKDLQEILADYYQHEPFIRVQEANDSNLLHNNFITITDCNNTNFVDLFVFGQQQLFIVARLDNLGKGAAGAAVQNLNLMLGASEDEGLSLKTT
jgi:N-acetyl-gamma-glutamyl-phosphate reductase